MTSIVFLQDVTEGDLLKFYEHQQDPEANRLAAFPAKDRQAFMAHWLKIMADDAISKETILFNEQVAGKNMLPFL